MQEIIVAYSGLPNLFPRVKFANLSIAPGSMAAMVILVKYSLLKQVGRQTELVSSSSGGEMSSSKSADTFKKSLGVHRGSSFSI